MALEKYRFCVRSVKSYPNFGSVKLTDRFSQRQLEIKEKFSMRCGKERENEWHYQRQI